MLLRFIAPFHNYCVFGDIYDFFGVFKHYIVPKHRSFAVFIGSERTDFFEVIRINAAHTCSFAFLLCFVKSELKRLVHSDIDLIRMENVQKSVVDFIYKLNRALQKRIQGLRRLAVLSRNRKMRKLLLFHPRAHMTKAVLVRNELNKSVLAIFFKLFNFLCRKRFRVLYIFGKIFIFKHKAVHIKLKLIVFQIGKYIDKVFYRFRIRDFSSAYIEHIASVFD